MLEIIIKWAVPFVCGGIVSGCISYIKALKQKNTALEDGVQSLLRAEIIRSHEKYTAKGYCPVYAKDALTRAYNAYHKLGGNDVATEIYQQILELPTERGDRT